MGPVVILASVRIVADASTSDSTRAVANVSGYEVMAGDVKGLGRSRRRGWLHALPVRARVHGLKSTCIDICADEWPPLASQGRQSGALWSRHPPGLLGTTVHVDGSVQVTYNGWPLYLWPDDLSPGQATGQGLNNVGGLWYVISPEGNSIR